MTQKLARWRRAGVLALCLGATAAAAPARTLLRDAGLEHSLRMLSQPVFAAAGLSPARMRVVVLDEDALNAFVLDAQTIVVNSGLVMRLDTAPQLQAVLAHEAAHIANGHITRRAADLRGAGRVATAGLLLSAVAAAAGGAEAGVGLAAGSAAAARRQFLAHSRAEEASADHAGVRYLADAGIDPQAAVDVLEMFRGQEALNVGRRDPYVQTHPQTRARLRALRGRVAAYDGGGVPDKAAAYWFARAKGKLSAFLRRPSWTLERVAGRGDDAALLRRAVALHRRGNSGKAVTALDRLVARRPDDPYLRDLRGQILLESRRPGAAVAAYARAVERAPHAALILAGYGRALLARGGARADRKALAVLREARGRAPRNPRMLRNLALAYARAGRDGMAALASAERYAVAGRLGTAATHARRALDTLPPGSTGRPRARDILRAAEAAG